MALDQNIEKSFRKSFSKTFNVRGSELDDILQKDLTQMPIEEILKNLGYDSAIPLNDLRQEFKGLYHCFLISSFAYHNKDSPSPRELGRRVGINHGSCEYYSEWFEDLNLRRKSPIVILNDQFKELLLKDNSREDIRGAAKVYGSFISKLFPIYLDVIASERPVTELKSKFMDLYNEIEKLYLKHIIKKNGNNYSKASKEMDLSRLSFRTIVERHNIPRKYCDYSLGRIQKDKDAILELMREKNYMPTLVLRALKIPMRHSDSLYELLADDLTDIQEKLINELKAGSLLLTAGKKHNVDVRTAHWLLQNKKEEYQRLEKGTIERTLTDTNGKLRRTAAILKINPWGIRRKLEKYGINIRNYVL